MATKAYIFPSYIFFTLFSILILRASFSYGRITSNDVLDSKKDDKVMGLGEVKQYLTKYGYLSRSAIGSHGKDSKGFETLDHSVEEAIKKFQVFYHLNVSGVLDKDTLSLMAKPRCGCSDLVNGGLGHSYYLLSTKWSKLNLTWALKPGTRADARQAIYYALRRWALATKFNFIESKNFDTSDLKIGFFRLNHGDSGPFDGHGGILAHAGTPPDGGVHFDADETWVNGVVPNGLDIETVALHELGHALGLGHSNFQTAIMFPYIPYGVIKHRLGADDVAGIKALYNFP